MILGSDRRGAEDVVLEVNPRLTTSYIGLRHIVCGNLAARMIDVARGEAVAGPLQLENVSVEFDVTGKVDTE